MDKIICWIINLQASLRSNANQIGPSMLVNITFAKELLYYLNVHDVAHRCR